MRLPSLADLHADAAARLRRLAEAHGGGPNAGNPASLLVSADLEPVALPPRFVLTGEAEQIARLLDENPTACWLIVAGALPERFLRSLLHPLRHRRRELVVVVSDPTRVFLGQRGPEWYRQQGVQLCTLDGIDLVALTVNPVAPQSHRFDSMQLRRLLRQAIPDVPILDVLYQAPVQTAGAG